MTQLNVMRNFARQLVHWLYPHLGANGLLGLGLCMVALAGFIYARGAAEESDLLQAKLEIAHARMTQLQASPPPSSRPSERLKRFETWFPATDTAVRDLRKIFLAARHSGVELSKGEYNQAAIDNSGGLQRYDVILPVKENYGAIKRFVGEVLNEIPHANLAELRVERPDSAEDEVDTRVHFVLYYRTPAT